MELTVRLFAGLRERAGAPTVTLELREGATAGDVLAAMDLPPRSCVVAVNREYVGEDVVIGPGDEVALIPPVSGGAGPHVRVTEEPLDVAALRALVADPRAGAVIVFEGVTREVERLDYEAYAEMAEPVLRRIAEEEVARHGLTGAAVEHRVGAVPLGEPSVLVVVSGGHREETFAGARAIIDRVKAEAPIWKKEIEGDRAEWVPGTLPTHGRPPGPPAS
jgi:MoaE-MoaD fusion protein